MSVSASVSRKLDASSLTSIRCYNTAWLVEQLSYHKSDPISLDIWFAYNLEGKEVGHGEETGWGTTGSNETETVAIRMDLLLQ